MKLRTLLLYALLIAGILPGCTPSTPAGSEPGSYEELMKALQENGVDAQQAEPTEQEFFSVPGRVLQIGEETIQVFEYPDPATRSEESALVGEDPSSIGTTMITWVDTPHFWAQDRLIVLYVGSNQEVLAALSQVLGEPLATGASPAMPLQPSPVNGTPAALAE